MSWSGLVALVVALVLCVVSSSYGVRLPTRGTLMAVAYGDQYWVAAGVGGNVYVSDDGISWDLRSSGVTVTLYGAAYCPDTKAFVAVGDNMGIVFSDDMGETWYVVNPPKANTARLKGVACVNSTFTAVTSGGNVLQSPNGYEWAIVTPGLGGNALWTVRSINNTFYAGGTGSIFTSDKGAKYIPHPLSQSTVYVFDLSGVSPTPGSVVYCLAASQSILLADEDLYRTRSVIRLPNGDQALGSAYVAFLGKFAVAATNGVYMSDTTLQKFELAPQSTAGRFWSIAVSPSRIVAVGDSGGNSAAFSSADGTRWV